MKTYQPHEQRVIDETFELDDRATKLSAFIKSEKFATLSEHEQELLRTQRTKQRELLAVLNQRVNLFTPTEVEDPQQEIDFGKRASVKPEQGPEEEGGLDSESEEEPEGETPTERTQEEETEQQGDR